MEITSAEILNWITRYGYIAIFLLLMLGIIGVPVPDEIVLTCSGFLIFKGFLSPELTLSCAFMGSVCGISLSYGLGRFVGMPIILKYGYLVHITPEKVSRVRIWYERFGKWILLFGYFIAGVRHLTAFTAGATRFSDYPFLPCLLTQEHSCGPLPLFHSDIFWEIIGRLYRSTQKRSFGSVW